MKIVFCLLTLCLASCGGTKNKQGEELTEERKTAPPRLIIGRVASVSENGSFVLIQKYGHGKLPKNTLFQSNGISGSEASLRPTGERVRDFFPADIVSGTAKRGDAVSGYPVIAKPSTQTSESALDSDGNSSEVIKKTDSDRKNAESADENPS